MHLGPPVRDGALHQLCSRPPEQLYLPHHDITGTCYCFVDARTIPSKHTRGTAGMSGFGHVSLLDLRQG